LFLSGFADFIFEGDDLMRILKHIFLHFIENDILYDDNFTLSSCYLSLILVSSYICLMLDINMFTGVK
jgi:hypothetical protein